MLKRMSANRPFIESAASVTLGSKQKIDFCFAPISPYAARAEFDRLCISTASAAISAVAADSVQPR